jgi:hypothetical protein
MQSELGKLYTDYPGMVVVLLRGQTADQFPQDCSTRIILTWEEAVEFLTDDFSSHHASIRNAAVILARELAKEGNDCGVEAIERAIKRWCHHDQCEFYEPSRARAVDIAEVQAAPAKLLELANNRQLWERSPAEIQRLMSLSSGILNWPDLLNQIEDSAGDEQATAFQLIATHLSLRAELAVG